MCSGTIVSVWLGFLLVALPTFAQEKSSWGIAFGFVPSWEVPSSLGVFFRGGTNQCGRVRVQNWGSSGS